MSELTQELNVAGWCIAADRIELLESTLRNATNILRDGGFVYVKEIDKRFPEFIPVKHKEST